MSYVVDDVLGVILRDAAEDDSKPGWHIVGRVQNAQASRSVTLEVLGHMKPADESWEASSAFPRETEVVPLVNLVDLSEPLIRTVISHEESSGGINLGFLDEDRDTIE